LQVIVALRRLMDFSDKVKRANKNIDQNVKESFDPVVFEKKTACYSEEDEQQRIAAACPGWRLAFHAPPAASSDIGGREHLPPALRGSSTT
ncbi:MAG: hypothetical protein K1Y36_27450, partial [Blastocatellia bacterium]|nr:hypothetical protein [Blastocatellia bacterium]